MSAASPLTNSAPNADDDAESNGPTSEPSRPTDPRRPLPPMRDAVSTVDEEDFDFHDTIPAPPWLDDADELTLPPAPTR